MPDIQVELDDDEDLIRVFARYPTETWNFAKLRPSDFARNMAHHSGISIWRLKYCTRNYAMSQWVTDKLKGTAICKAKTLKTLGMTFFASSETGAHVSARCLGCDRQVDYASGLCAKLDLSACSLNLREAAPLLSKTLSNKQFFTVDLPVVIS